MVRVLSNLKYYRHCEVRSNLLTMVLVSTNLKYYAKKQSFNIEQHCFNRKGHDGFRKGHKEKKPNHFSHRRTKVRVFSNLEVSKGVIIPTSPMIF